ncbi:MAG: hypothetical protein EZS28_051349 [Streblomastix strix]|uniref:Uncharacterized protein n=1 Tax=Streblomastix strix TaxID=222440 RepID=A0A5J4T6X2_9EUKA|nr:MAG: hypothetical protein EZS28_051349 [Streblomastix strix]
MQFVLSKKSCVLWDQANKQYSLQFNTQYSTNKEEQSRRKVAHKNPQLIFSFSFTLLLILLNEYAFQQLILNPNGGYQALYKGQQVQSLSMMSVIVRSSCAHSLQPVAAIACSAREDLLHLAPISIAELRSDDHYSDSEKTPKRRN